MPSIELGAVKGAPYLLPISYTSERRRGSPWQVQARKPRKGLTIPIYSENMKMIKKTCCITLTLALGLTAGAAQAFSLGDAAKLTTAIAAPESSAAKSAELVTKLTDLNVSSEQAVGGTSALLNLAKNQLAGADYTQLMNSVPALQNLSGNNLSSKAGAVSGLLGKSNPLAKTAAQSEMHSLGDVGNAFSGLGMDAGMISQFAPILLQFIGGQGVSQPLMSSLASIWTTPATAP